MKISRIISRMDKLLFINTNQAFQEYSNLMDTLNSIDPKISSLLAERHARLMG